MANLPGLIGTALPGVYTQIETLSSGTSITGGARVAAIIGQGTFSETLMASALGGGKDGLNPTWTSTNGADGYHFQLSQAPIISNRTQLFKNGLPLKGTEGTATSFDQIFDYQVDITTGHITLQTAHLIDQGGSFYTASSFNTGVGIINNLALVDTTAPSETWTIKCINVQRTSGNVPIANTATFVAFGSVSGNILDGYGNPVTWISNNIIVSNGILSFSIQETASTPFVPGDTFTVKVYSGVLNKNDSLSATYIPTININLPIFLQTMKDISTTFGLPSTTNNLSLGCQLAFANSAPGIMCVQAAPPLPRRTSYILEDSFQVINGDGYLSYVLPFPEDVIPDINANIHIFATDPSTKIETQLLANKFPFYTVGTGGGNPTITQFVTSNVAPPAGYDYSYTVISQSESIVFAQDGYVNRIGSTTFFSTATYTFLSTDVGRNVTIIDATNGTNVGTFPITAVSGGIATITNVSSVTEHNVTFEVVDPTETGAYLVLNWNIVPIGNQLRVTIVDQRDASFFDAGWLNALASLETQECDIVVPLPNQTISVIFQNALDHCLSMSNISNKKERILLIGAINGLTPSNLTGASLAAVEDIGVLEGIQGDTVAEVLSGNTEDLANYSVSAAFGNTYRAVYFFPDQIVVSASGNNIVIDGFYQAAAAAGFFAGNGNIAMPLTNKTLTGFTILRNRQFSPFTIQQLVNSGITVVQPVQGGGNVIWGITTTQSGFVEEQEISIVFIRDRIAKTMRAGFQAFIGQPEDDALVAKLSGRAQSILSSFITQNLISAYKDLLVVRDSVDPTQWDITVRVQPTYPVNFIFIKVSVGLI